MIRPRFELLSLVLAVAIAPVLTSQFAGPAWAENPADVQQLLLTGRCASCDLTGADLRDAHLIGVDLRGANLGGADLTGANLEGADLTGTNLEGANLASAMLTNASLNYAQLNQANLSGATLYHTEVAGVVFDTINLTGAQILETPISVGGN